MSRADGAGGVSPQCWERELHAFLGHPVRVVYGRSRTSPLQVRPPTAREARSAPALRGGLVVRMHSIFAAAPADVRDAVARWIRSGKRARRASRLMGEWMDRALAELPPRPARPGALSPRGAHHDLEVLAGELLATELAGAFGADRAAPGVTWGRRQRSRTRGGLRLGSYESTAHVARVHPVLDQSAVPRWFVRYVLFHELLHAAQPPERDTGGRTLHHGPRFRAREERYRDYARALVWQEAHVEALVRSARRGRPMRIPREPRAASPPRGTRQLALFSDA